MLCSHFFLTLQSVLRGLEETTEYYFSLGIAAEIKCLALIVQYRVYTSYAGWKIVSGLLLTA